MPNYGQPDLKISVAADTTTALIDISNHVDTFNGALVEAISQQSDAFGDSWVESLYVGVKRMDPFVLEGFINDATGTPYDLFGDVADLGQERMWEIDFGASNVLNGKAIVSNFSRVPRRNELTRYRVTLSPSSAVGTAT